MPVEDYEICSVADADSSRGVRGLMRITRRTIKRCWLDRETIMSPRVFCQNIGGCGSTYIVKLLHENGIEKVFHEKSPDFNELGVQHFNQPISQSRLVKLLRYTRHNVFFEANNRFFSMSQELAASFPAAKFIHLFRNPADSIRGNMSKPNVEEYAKTNLRLNDAIGINSKCSSFEKFCCYWRNSNQRIHDDLKSVCHNAGQEYLTLDFDDLIAGRIESLESYLGIELKAKVLPPVNQRPTGPSGRFPEFEHWTSEQQNMLQEICIPLFDQLKFDSGKNLKHRCEHNE